MSGSRQRKILKPTVAPLQSSGPTTGHLVASPESKGFPVPF
jgi:hypothetical protein